VKHSWCDEDLADLGKLTDKALAHRMGVDMATVRRQRIRLGISAFKPHPVVKPWTAEEVALLGTMTDQALGRITERETTAVQQKRQSLKIPAMKKKPPVVWSDEDLAELGQVPDQQIAKRKGISSQTVWAKRQELGIAALPLKLRDSRSTWTAADIALFGTMTDAQVSVITGRPEKSVLQERLRLHIAAYTIPVTSMHAVPARSGLTVSWGALVDLGQREFFGVLAGEYQERTGRKLTLRKLSKLTLWDEGRLKSWFQSQDEFFALPITARHHIWLAVAYSV
jgi:hypothetical protein